VRRARAGDDVRARVIAAPGHEAAGADVLAPVAVRGRGGAGRRRDVVVLGALARAVPRGAVALPAAVAVVGVGVAGAVGSGRTGLLALQLATPALAGSAVALLQEPGAPDAVPTTLARRRGLLLGAAAVPLVALWVVLLALAGAGSADAGALTWQLAAVTSLALGLGARGGDPVQVVAGVTLAFAAARGLTGPSLLTTDVTALWWIGAIGAGLLALAAFSRDRR
jgi:hypothetical protein